MHIFKNWLTFIEIYLAYQYSDHMYHLLSAQNEKYH